MMRNDIHKDLADAVEMALPGEACTPTASCPSCRGHVWRDAYVGMTTHCPECDGHVELREMRSSIKPLLELVKIAEDELVVRRGHGFCVRYFHGKQQPWFCEIAVDDNSYFDHGSTMLNARARAATAAIKAVKGKEDQT